MPTKQATSKKATVAKTVEPAPAARVTKPGTPRIKQVTHSKSAPVAGEVIAEEVVAIPAPLVEDSRDAIAKIAYGYWEARGYQPGNQEEDWFRAESEYRASVSTF